MRKTLLSLLLSALCFNYTYAQNKAAICFVNKDSVYDFGSIFKGDKASYQFEIKNTGNKALIITNIKSNTCDFKFTWTKKPLKPHRKTLIYITCNQKETGTFSSDVFITSNVTQQPYPFIHVSGTVIPKPGAPVIDPPQDHIQYGAPPPGLNPQ